MGSWKALRALTSEHLAGTTVALPNGFKLVRNAEQVQLAQALAANPITVLHGESGAGKSALAKGTLDAAFPDAAQVWLGPEEAAIGVNQVKRSSAGLAHPLADTLQATAHKANCVFHVIVNTVSTGW